MIDKNTKLVASKTPYELRFDLLAMARDTLEAEYHAKMDHARWAREVGAAVGFTDIPSYPGRDDIFKLAEQLKEFVEKK